MGYLPMARGRVFQGGEGLPTSYFLPTYRWQEGDSSRVVGVFLLPTSYLLTNGKRASLPGWWGSSCFLLPTYLPMARGRFFQGGGGQRCRRGRPSRSARRQEGV